MANCRTMIFMIFALVFSIATSVFAGTEFKQNDLAWPNKTTLTSCNGTNFAGSQFYIIPENFSFTNTLNGGGAPHITFSIVTNPISGTVTMLNNVNGSNVYIPNNNYLGYDYYVYQVMSSCPASSPSNGLVVLNVMTNELETCFTWFLTNSLGGNPYILCGPSGFVEFALVVGPTTSGGPTLFDTNKSWIFTVTDTSNAVTPTTWYYLADTPPTQWSPAVLSGQGPPAVFFNASLVSCPPVNDVVSGQLCPCAGVTWSSVPVNSGGVGSMVPSYSSGPPPSFTYSGGTTFSGINPSPAWSTMTTDNFQNGGNGNIFVFASNSVAFVVSTLTGSQSPVTSTVHIKVSDAYGSCLDTNFAYSSVGTNVFYFKYNTNQGCQIDNVTFTVSNTNGIGFPNGGNVSLVGKSILN